MWAWFGIVLGCVGLERREIAPEAEVVSPNEDETALVLELGPEDALQPALDALGRRGGTLLLRAGRYEGPFVLEVLRAPVEVRSASGARDVVLEGGAIPGSVLTVRAERTSEILLGGLVWEGGQAERGGGLALLGGDTRIVDSSVTGSEATQGGGIYVSSAGLQLEEVELDGNTASLGGGIAAMGSAVALVGSTLSRNDADLGGGIFAADAALSADAQTRLEGNEATGAGGGLYLLRSSFWGGRVSGNQAVQGGGASLEQSELDEVSLDHNVASSEGGGLHVQPGAAPSRALGLDLSHNLAGERGGGLLVSGSALTLTQCRLFDNTSPVGGGAALVLSGVLDGEEVQFGENYASDIWTEAGAFSFEGEVSFSCTEGGC